MLNGNSYIEFNSYLSIDLIKVQKNEEEHSITPYEIATQKENREKIDTNTTLFTTFGQQNTDIFYFNPDDSLSNATISIFRKSPYQKYYTFICTLNNGISILDYNVLNDNYYHYMASAMVDTNVEPKDPSKDPPRIRYYIYENKDSDGNDIYIHSAFDGWSICDIEDTNEENIYHVSDTIWKLGLNVEGESITRNRGVNSWDTLGRYPKQSYGSKDYDSSQFTGLLGSFKEYKKYNLPEKSAYINTPSDLYQSDLVYEYTEKINISNSHAVNVEKLNRWLEFINNGNLKLLRDIKGKGWIIQVIDTNSYDINNQSNYKQTTISFQWKEVEDINKCSIIELI